MPSFPASVFAPTTKTAAQTIQAAHVNDVQDEIVAIEGGYRNATAPLNSSNSTLAARSGVGHSTWARPIPPGTIPTIFPARGGATGQVLTCVSTSGSTMGLEGRAVTAEVAVVGGSTTLIPANTTTAITWPTDDYISNSSMHSTASNPERLTPQSTGVYRFTANVSWGAARGAFTRVIIHDSSGGVIAWSQDGSTSGTEHGQFASAIKRFDALGGWARVVVRAQDTTNSMANNNNEQQFSMVKL